ncbi:sigma-54 interaction domain-containing protein [Pectobacterium aroidearum]|uniref:sigma-54 interaction domain-containing protein n=1 Tax=Pectobacterium aroidearum TaxID=1201031 RepID=UPI002114A891|nr:sigma-54 dependent transcriptional regulator [Pectobacterium aroidearum]UUE46039.1 sigma-54 dependent transcriptional regulator [Pectobacterium aroidearum]UUE50259.1 sigma-54 dependent transcriptional regulator [Pectobacterium aroidearum]UUE54464.1 sigma-54 dependent transcriptional regulator [Pectobacterium aroidearum]UUE62873.1 sigma-54 dependent transcriptional regulator [Pectobacterium aroidearum]UUE67096.1 sigma-54 dependent transcriptional regulator [Pectobacterium aroidearum]
MQHALELALALTRQHDEAGLCDWLLETMQAAWQPQGMLLGMVDVSGRHLTCQGRVHDMPVELNLGVDDFSHPLAYALHKNQARTWDSLYGGARIEHRDFRQMLISVGTNCGLHAQPLLSDSGKPLAVLALLDTPTRLQTLHQRGECERLAQVFCRQLILLRELAHTRREQVALRDSLRQIKDEGQSRREQEKRVETTLVGQSTVIKALHQQIYQAAKHRLSVLIQGETGSGKDVVARLLHQCSERASKPFIAINCAAIPENLIESELFGYQKGAFSGAQSNKIGLVEQANGGTLFLDEVGDMPQSMQAKLLRVLETHSFRPLGAEKEVHSDFRLIAATHQPLEQHVSDGVFRQDLYHRLCQCLLQVAPLRERPDDIRLLCEHFINQFADKQQKHVGPLNRAFLRQLVGYDFPGNVRELRNLLEVACAHTPDGEALYLASLPPELRERLTSSTAEEQDRYQHIHDLRIATQRYEAAVIEARLRQFQGNRLLVADSLNIPKRTLDHKCQKLEVN